MIIIPLRGPSCKLRLARSSAKLSLQDGPSVVIDEHLLVGFFFTQALYISFISLIKETVIINHTL